LKEKDASNMSKLYEKYKIYQICEISKFGLHLASLPQKSPFSVLTYNHKDEHLAKKKSTLQLDVQ